jgi:hemolysin activation/secretion protein
VRNGSTDGHQARPAEAAFRPAKVAARLVAGTLPLLALLVAAPAWAQAVPAPPTRDELLPDQSPPDTRRSVTLSVDGELARTPCALDNPELGDIRVTLSQVSFAGAEAATGTDLSAAYAPYLGRELPISVLCDIRARATQILSDAGYLAAVEIPEQRLDGGAAQFRVVLGRLTAVRVRGEAGPSENLLARYLQNMVGQPVFNTREAERYLLLADDIPGLDVRLSLRPAANGQPGDLIGEVAVLRRTAVVDLNVQNYGSSALGRFGGLLRAELYDLTGAGDRTTVSLYSSHDFDEQRTVQLGHDFTVGSEGLSLGGKLTLGWTNPTLGIANFDVRSDTMLAAVHASYPHPAHAGALASKGQVASTSSTRT